MTEVQRSAANPSVSDAAEQMSESSLGADWASLAAKDSRLAQWIRRFGVILAVLTLVGAGLSLWVGRGLELERWRQTALNLSVAVAEHVAQSVHGADLVLKSVAGPLNEAAFTDAAALQRAALDPATREILHDRIAGMPQIAGAAIVSTSGTVLCSTRELPVATSDIADAEFSRAMARANEAVYVSRPRRESGSGAWVFFLLRQIHDRSGTPLGGVVVAVRDDFFVDFFRSVSLRGASWLSLFRLDGVLMARYPNREELLGRAFPERIGLLRASPDGASVQLRELSGPLLDGEPAGLRLVASRRLLDYPLAVMFTISDDVILAFWRATAQWVSVLAGGLSAAVLTLSWLLARMLDRRRWIMGELARTQAAAEAAAQARGDFLALMSHEIRTPMNAILGMNAMLQRTALTEEQRYYTRLVGEGGESLIRLLDDVLENARLEAGRVELEMLDFSPRALAEGVVALLAPRAAEKGLRLSTEIDPALPEGLRGDRARIRQVLLNLLANAVKFTEAGSVVLRLRPVMGAGGDGKALSVRFEVSDTGIGISPEARGRLFQKFAQADGSISRRYGGSGLGLAICRQLVGVMGGRIGLKSQPGAGSTFFFELPLPPAEAPLPAAPPPGLPQPLPAPAPQPAAAPVPRSQPAREPARPGLRVLLADDDALNRKVGLAMLRRLGHQVTMAVDGATAVAAAEEGGWDVVLMDVQMPRMDGLAATRRIRALPAPNGCVPIFALSAEMQPETEKECRAAGMDGWMSKPLDMEELARWLDEIAGTRKSREA